MGMNEWCAILSIWITSFAAACGDLSALISETSESVSQGPKGEQETKTSDADTSASVGFNGKRRIYIASS